MKHSIFVACDGSNLPVKAFYDRNRAEAFAKVAQHSNGSVYEVAVDDLQSEDLLIEGMAAELKPVKSAFNFHFSLSFG